MASFGDYNRVNTNVTAMDAQLVEQNKQRSWRQ